MVALSRLSGREQCATFSAVPGAPNAQSADPVEVAPVPRNQIEVVFKSSRRDKSVGHADIRRTPNPTRALGDRRIDRELCVNGEQCPHGRFVLLVPSEQFGARDYRIRTGDLGQHVRPT
jgi:hypothetical protein